MAWVIFRTKCFFFSPSMLQKIAQMLLLKPCVFISVLLRCARVTASSG